PCLTARVVRSSWCVRKAQTRRECVMTATPSPETLEPQGLASSVVRIFGDSRFRTDGELLALAFATDGSLWSIEESGVLRLWDTTTGKQRDWRFLSNLETLWTFDGQARLLASASDDLALWHVPSGQQLTVLEQPSWVTALRFHENSSVLATGHDHGAVCLWD